MQTDNGKGMFPCPVCLRACDVRRTKKDKPYITCDPCGIQVFVRGPAGIAEFNRLVERAAQKDVWTKLGEIEDRYHPKCPECGNRFWLGPELIETSMFDGSLKGFRCPQKDCDAIVKWEREK